MHPYRFRWGAPCSAILGLKRCRGEALLGRTDLQGGREHSSRMHDLRGHRTGSEQEVHGGAASWKGEAKSKEPMQG